MHFLVALDLLELTSDRARDKLGGVGVGEETRRVLLESLDREARSGVGTVSKDTGGEGTLETPVRVSELEIISETTSAVDRVGESETGRTGSTDGALVDVGSCLSWGLILTTDVNSNVLLVSAMPHSIRIGSSKEGLLHRIVGWTYVTDGVFPGVQAIGEGTKATLGTGYNSVVGVNDRTRGGIADQGRCEVHGEVLDVFIVEPFGSVGVLVHVVVLVVGDVVRLDLVVFGPPDGLPVLVVGIGVASLGWDQSLINRPVVGAHSPLVSFFPQFSRLAIDGAATAARGTRAKRVAVVNIILCVWSDNWL